ncbi:MAG: hypothetical protein K2I08_00385 [Muribaculaceae bacterium]|nr:hypothetical protein [Muribaculaceae bacterium]
MINYIEKLVLTALICLGGCNKRSDNHKDMNGPIAEDSIPARDSVQLTSASEQECDSIVKSDTITTYTTPSEKELKDLQSLILDRLQELKGNPLQPNIYGIGLLPDAVEVYLEINTKYWQNEFRKNISNSPYVKFSGDAKPTPISEIVDSIIKPDNITLRPDKPSFPTNSEYATFTITNESEKNINFEEYYVVGYRGKDGKWYRLPNPGMFNDIGIELKPTGKYTFDASLTPLLNNNQPGAYRLYKSIRFEGEKKKVWLMTEFILE